MTLRTGASLIALCAALSFSPPAMAQSPSTPQTPRATQAPKAPVTGQILKQEESTLLAKDLIGATVYAPDKAKIGSISDLILSKDGKNVQGFVLGVGGFLGLGEKSVALQMDRLQMSHDQNGIHLIVDAKKDELANAPAFKSRKDMESEQRAAERARSQPTPGQPTRPAQRP